MKRSIILPCLVTAFVALSPAGVALADNPHPSGTTGQPNKEASDDVALKPPGLSTGSGDPAAVGGAAGTGFANAESRYANPDTAPMQANDHAVSQYDVAGFQWCTHHTDPPHTSC
jgi:hypothetical protein